MKILALETSVGRTLNLALSDNAQIILKDRIEPVEELAGGIVPAIAGILRSARLPLSSVDGFALDIGPGSFTGLRIGLSAAKALALATGKPLVGVSSLEILADSVDSDCQICALIDAKRENVYARLFKKKEGGLRAVTPYLLTSIDCLLKKVNKKTIFLGDALYLYRKKISQSKKGLVFFTPEKLWFPSIENLAKIAYGRFKNKETDNPEEIVPVYLYPKECQIRKK